MSSVSVLRDLRLEALPGAKFMGRNMPGSQRCHLLRLSPYYIDVATGAKWVGNTYESSSVAAVCVMPTSYTAVRPSAKCIAGCLSSAVRSLPA